MRKHQGGKGAKDRRKARRAEERKDDLTFYRHPLSDIPREVILPRVLQMARDSATQFDVLLSEIRTILREVDPLSLLAQISYYGLTGSIDEKGKVTSWAAKSGFNQSHVELLQALSLQVPVTEFGNVPASTDVVERCLQTLPELGESFSSKRMIDLEKDLPEEQGAIRLLQEHLRLHTQTVRNWGYFDKVAGIAEAVCARINDAFLRHLGISATQTVAIFHALLEMTEENVNDHMDKLSNVWHEDTAIVSKYCKQFGYSEEIEAGLLAAIVGKDLTKDQLRFLLICHSDTIARAHYTFTAQDVATRLALPVEPVKQILDKMSLNFGSLSDKLPEYLFLDNPIWIQPVIRIDADKYFCCLPQGLFSFIFPVLNHLISEIPSLKTAYHLGRSEFLEAEIERLFAKAFPLSEIKPSYKWKEGALEFETDLILRVDSYLFIVEAKSHSVAWPALRGSADRARRHIQHTILEPSEQSWRLASRVQEVLEKPERLAELLPNFPVALDDVHTVVRLSVTLEDFAVVQTNQGLLKETGWIPKNHRLAPCILLADLELVFDMLDSMGERIHYLKRRAELSDNLLFVADEIDLLGFYLDTGFNIGLTEFGGEELILTGCSKKVDDYCIARSEGIVTEKPRLRITERWRAVLDAIEQKRFKRWADTAYILLNMAFDEQKKTEKMFAEICTKVQKTFTDPKHLCSVVVVPHERRTDALILYAFKEAEKSSRLKTMRGIASQTFEGSHVQRCLVLGVNIDQPKHPYSTLACFWKSDAAARVDIDVM
ncbi:MAG: hypothetical protein HZB55_23580 [Deltaproteobacteria bacterium]|nr:hypothetical protein [Deltaproteobacteria bacterium]